MRKNPPDKPGDVMEALLILLAIGYGLLPVILLFWVSALGRRIARLESSLSRSLQGQTDDAAATAPLADLPVAEIAPEPQPAAPVAATPAAATAESVAAESATAASVADPWSGKAVAPSALLPVAGATQPGGPGQDQPIVFRADRIADLVSWLKINWVYLVSAASLAAAGIFLVQYGVEKGLVPPVARVGLSLALGAVLVLAGEWLRRKRGDSEDVATAYLPQVFAGAGIVVLFGAVIAARQIYGLIGAEVAFGGLVLVAALAVVLGWFHGQLLAAVGLLGAAAAPFVVGGDTESTDWLYGYFTLIGAAGLAIDAARRWAWISVLALVLAFGCNWLTLVGYGGAGIQAMAATLLVLLTMALPVWRLWPAHDGPMVSEAVVARGAAGWPGFPVRLVAGSVLAGSVLIVLSYSATAAEDWVLCISLVVMALALILWAHRAPALADLAVIPAAAFLFRLGTQGGHDAGPLALAYQMPLAEGGAAPWSASWLLALATAISLAAGWRALRNPAWPRAWGLGAALVAPLAAVALELVWHPALVVGPYAWALQIIALAALMVAMAARFANEDGGDHARMAYATLSALSLIALSVFVLTTGSALTLALAVLVVVALALDRRFALPQMTVFVQVAVAALGWRLVVDPGVDWAVNAPIGTVILTFGGVLAALAAGMWLILGRGRLGAQAVLESAFAGFAAILANVLLERWVPVPSGWMGGFTHWNLSLHAMPWLVMALVQLYRLKIGGWLRWVRIGLAGIAGLIAAVGIGAAAGPLNPLFDAWQEVGGTLPFDTLLLAYALPALLLLATLRPLAHLPHWLRIAMVSVGSALLGLWLGLEIRHFWQGPVLALPGVSQPELYTYTVALLLTGAALLYQAIARRSVLLRRLAMAVIGITVAKVFLIDAAGLSGLTRVFSFLALGLSLAGLAWLNRWAAGRGTDEVAVE